MIIDREIIDAFKAESMDFIKSAETAILEIEKQFPTMDENKVTELKRSLHTIKGMSASVGYENMSHFSHVLEDLVDKVVQGGTAGGSNGLGLLLKGMDTLRSLVENPGLNIEEQLKELAQATEGKKPQQSQSSESQQLSNESQQLSNESQQLSNESQQLSNESQQLSKISEPKKETTNIGTVGKPFQPPAPASPLPTPALHIRENTARIPVTVLDTLMNLASELVLARNQNTQALSDKHYEQLELINQRLSNVVTALQNTIIQTRMRSIGTVFERFSRYVRDLSKNLMKSVTLNIVGSEVELDQRVIDGIVEPLMHLIRNAVDHGIEPPQDRERNGKPPQGNIELRAFYRASQVNLQISDDGKGMDPKELRDAVVKKGLLSFEQAKNLSDADALSLIFLSGFSTAKEVSEISGRGIGMDAVRASLQSLGGTVELSSVVGQGTVITIKLPLSLAIIPALIVSTHDYYFAISQNNVEQIIWLHGTGVYQSLKRVNDEEVFSLRGELVPVVELGKVLNIDTTYKDPNTGEIKTNRRSTHVDRRKHRVDGNFKAHRTGQVDRRTSLSNSVFLVIIRLGLDRFAVLVERIVDSEEIVVNSLHPQMKNCRVFSGTTILGDGEIAFIIDMIGVAEIAGIKLSESRKIETGVTSFGNDMENVLLFTVGGHERFAIPLLLIQRIENILTKNIERIGEKEYLNYRGSIIPLVRIESTINVSSSYQDDNVFVIIPKLQSMIGIITADIEDIRELKGNIDSVTVKKNGIRGTVVMDGKTTLLLDPFALAKTAGLDAGLGKTQQDCQPKRVLIVDDSHYFRIVSGVYLESLGIEVITAENGNKGLEVLAREKVDGIISDLEMPEMGGFQFAQQVRKIQNLSKIPMLAFSGSKDPEMVTRALDAGFDAFCPKTDQFGIYNALKKIGVASTILSTVII